MCPSQWLNHTFTRNKPESLQLGLNEAQQLLMGLPYAYGGRDLGLVWGAEGAPLGQQSLQGVVFACENDIVWTEREGGAQIVGTVSSERHPLMS